MTSFTHSFNFSIPEGEEEENISSSSLPFSTYSSSTPPTNGTLHHHPSLNTRPASKISSTAPLLSSVISATTMDTASSSIPSIPSTSLSSSSTHSSQASSSSASSFSSFYRPPVPAVYGKLRQAYRKIQWGETIGCTFDEGDIVYIHWLTSSPFELDVSKIIFPNSSSCPPNSSSSSSLSTLSTLTTERNMVPVQSIELLYTLRDKETQLTGIYTSNSDNCYMYDSVWPTSASSSSHSKNPSNVIIAPLVLEPGLGSYVWPLTKSVFLRQIYRQKSFVVHSTGSRLLQFRPDFHNFHVPTMIQYASRITVWMKNIRNQKMQYIDNVPPEIALACYRSGHSLYFNPSLDIQKKYLLALCQDLDMNFGITMLNDASPGGDIEIFAVQGKHSTPWHFDGQENFTVQLVGTKRWRFCPSRITDPLTNLHPSSTNTKSIEDDKKVHRTYSNAPLEVNKVPGIRYYQEQEQARSAGTDDDGSIMDSRQKEIPNDKVTTVVLRPGSVLYVPAGWWHAVDSEDDEGSLSINFSVSGGRWNDFFLRRFIQVLWQQPLWRERITVPSNNPEHVREQFTKLVKELPQVIHNLGQHSTSIGHTFLPDALFDPYRSKRIIVHDKDKEQIVTLGTANKEGFEEDKINQSNTTKNNYKQARLDKQSTIIRKHDGNGIDNTNANANDAEEDHSGQEDDDNDEEENTVLYSTHLVPRIFTPQTILYRNPLQIMVIKGGTENPTLSVAPDNRKRSRNASSGSSSSVVTTGSRRTGICNPYIHIEIHSGFGSIAAESFLSDTVQHVYVPSYLLPLIQYIENLSPSSSLSSSSSSLSTTTTTGTRTTSDSSSSSLSINACFRIMNITVTGNDTNYLDNYGSIKGLLTSLCHTGYFHDPRNVSASEFVCGGLIMSFYNTTTQQQDLTDCGKEIMYNESQTRPTFILPQPNLTDRYVIIIVDRDAPSASNPIRSPLRHYASYNITGDQLRSPGLSPSTAVNDWFNYSGPQPPANSGCHRYYGMVYRQSSSLIPNLILNTSDPTNRLNWNFVEWAKEQNLTKVGVNYWMTQNMNTRVSGCSMNPSNGGITDGRRMTTGTTFTMLITFLVGWMMVTLYMEKNRE